METTEYKKINWNGVYVGVSTRNPLRSKVKLYPLYAMEAQGGRGGIAPTHT
jgi:hypothetical protein